MATIKKPDANPIVALLLTALIFNLGHLIVNGQQRKWMFTLIAIIVLNITIFGGMIVWAFSIVDAFQTAERLQKGEEIGENEYTFELLYKVMSIVDKTATLKGAAPAA